MRLNLKQQCLLLSYEDLLIFGNSVLSRVQLELDKVRLKKKILYLTMGAVQSYSEGILELIYPPRIFAKAAEVLIRSLTEASINIDYIYSIRDESRARLFVVHSLLDNIDFAKKFVSLKMKYPNWTLAFDGIDSIEDWEQFIVGQKKEVSKLQKKYDQKFSTLPGVRNRAECADNYLKEKNELIESRSQEALYVKYYKFFSHVTHLTMPGLERFYDCEEGVVSIDSKVSGMERVVLISYQRYFSFLRFFSHKFEVYQHENFKSYSKKAKALTKYSN